VGAVLSIKKNEVEKLRTKIPPCFFIHQKKKKWRLKKIVFVFFLFLLIDE